MFIKTILKPYIHSHLNCKISHILQSMNIYYIHDESESYSEWMIKNPNYGLIIRYSKVKSKGLFPVIKVHFKDPRISIHEIVKLGRLKEYIKTFR